MVNRVKISDFVKLTGCTLKTVIYYHKIGLLKEPERSQAGYRLYGPEELSRMQLIKHLKSLGLDLKRIKEILGDERGQKTFREVLQSLHSELLDEKKSLEERIEKIDRLLSEDMVPLEEEGFETPSFQMVMDILGQDQTGKYNRICPELFEQQRKVYSILDDFQWGEDYRETFRALAEFFKDHPQEYQSALEYGVRLSRLAKLAEDDPEVEALAREASEFVTSMPQLMEILGKQAGIKEPLESLYSDMTAKVIPPAQIKYGLLFRQFLAIDKNGGSFHGR